MTRTVELAERAERLPGVEVARLAGQVLDRRDADARGVLHRGGQRLARAPPAVRAGRTRAIASIAASFSTPSARRWRRGR